MIANWTGELEREVASLRDAILADASKAVLQDAARHTGGLPVYCDIGGCLAITPDGEIVEYSLDDERVTPVTDPRLRRLALAAASESYSQLASLKPRDGVELCQQCRGTGKVLDGIRCGCCEGTGWVVESARALKQGQ